MSPELSPDVLQQKINNKEINVEDIYQLAVAYGGDATKIIALATKNATNQELMNLINKAEKNGGKEITEALKGERQIRIIKHESDIKAILDSAIIGTQVAGPGATEPKYDFTKLNEDQWQKLTNSFGNLQQLGYSIPPVGVSTTSLDALKKVFDNVVNEQIEAIKSTGMEVTSPLPPYRQRVLLTFTYLIRGVFILGQENLDGSWAWGIAMPTPEGGVLVYPYWGIFKGEENRESIYVYPKRQ